MSDSFKNTAVDPLFLIQYLQEAQQKHSRLYDFLVIIHRRILQLQLDLAALTATVAALPGATVVESDGVIVSINGIPIGQSNQLDFSGDEEISVSANMTTRININIELIDLQRRFRRLLKDYVTTFERLPEGLDTDLQKAFEET